MESKKITKEKFKNMRKQAKQIIWGRNSDIFNTVADTPFFVNFLTLQLFRFLSAIILISLTIVYTYIYVRSTIFNLSFWALLCTLLSFGFLLIGSGKQVCYQKRVELNMISFDDPKMKTTLWQTGLFFYT
mmetsp:Transcript_16428/g.27846  ORF Transcript_16428/g.27846 Transcript_16428/m.27846 type:complete len:130 (+) Transcript_16428:116-505(+)